MNAPLTALMPPDETETDEYLEIAGPPGYTTEDDGEDGLIVTLPGFDQAGGQAQGDHEFYANLADDILPDAVLDTIATDLLRKIEEDKQNCQPRDEQYEEGIRRTGMGKDAPGGAPFEGASKVVHPMLTEACVDFQARTMKELWRPSGPCRPNVVLDMTKDRFERAKRKADYMNWQLTVQMKEARPVVEQMLSQLPLGGTQFIRLWFDRTLRRPRMSFVPIDKVYIPGSAASYETSDRRTFSDTISTTELKRRILSGMYRQVSVTPSAESPEQSKAQEANRKIEGVKQPGLNIDGDREIYETMAILEVSPQMAEYLDQEQEGDLYPYLITMDLTTRKVLAMYRDWEPDQEGTDTHEPIEHLFDFGFLPWRGPYSVGLPHVMAGLPGAATGALRALLDSAFVANTQGGLILKGSNVGAQARRANPNEFIEIEGGIEAADIRQKVMQFNTKEPSTVLFQLLGFLVEAGKGIVRTSMDDASIDASSTVPVGTQLSRVEEGLNTFSSIHGRIHTSFNRLLSGLHRINRLYLPRFAKAEHQGKMIRVRRRDFEGEQDVIPVSDPTICSDQVRMGQVNAMQQRAAMVPGLYNAREVEVWFLELMRVPDKDRFLAAQPKPEEMNAVNENVAMALGRPVVAFPDQDHLAHLQVLLDFMSSPVLGMNPLIAQRYMPAALNHAVEHLVYYYVHQVTETVQSAAGVPVNELFSKDQNVKSILDQLLAKVSATTVPGLQQSFSKALQVLQQGQQLVQQLSPPQPQDPAAVAAQASAAETQRKTAADQTKAQIDQGKLALAGQKMQQDGTVDARTAAGKNVLDLMKIQSDKEKAELDAQVRLTTTKMDNEVALTIAEAEIMQGHKTNLSTGSSMRGT